MTSLFSTVSRSVQGGLVLHGDFVAAPELAIQLVLESEPAANPPAGRQMHMLMGLGGASDTLLVLFNSLGRPFDGFDTRWEFYDLPRRIACDFVRIAERDDPAFWYIDKAEAISATLQTHIPNRYRRVMLAGMSSGGFASLMVATMLAQRFPALPIETFTINPQTGHDPRHRRFMETLPSAIPPALISNGAFAAIGHLPYEIAPLLDQVPAALSTHHVFYDHDNPAERYYVDLIRGRPGVRPVPYHFGVGHMSGCLAMMERGVVRDAIADRLAAD